MAKQEPNFAMDRNGGRWSRSLGAGILIPLDGQESDSVDGRLVISLSPEEAERQHGPLDWHKRPESIDPNDFQPNFYLP